MSLFRNFIEQQLNNSHYKTKGLKFQPLCHWFETPAIYNIRIISISPKTWKKWHGSGTTSAWVALHDTHQIWFLSFHIWFIFEKKTDCDGIHKNNCQWRLQEVLIELRRGNNKCRIIEFWSNWFFFWKFQKVLNLSKPKVSLRWISVSMRNFDQFFETFVWKFQLRFRSNYKMSEVATRNPIHDNGEWERKQIFTSI